MPNPAPSARSGGSGFAIRNFLHRLTVPLGLPYGQEGVFSVNKGV